MNKLSLDKFNFIIDCQFIRFDGAGKCHWVMYQRSRTLTPAERARLCAIRGCIRCETEMEVRESMPYCPVCLEKTKIEEDEWCREEKRAQAAKNKAESELAKKDQEGTAVVPKTWTEASVADKAARDAKKKKKKPEIRKTVTLKDMLKAEEIKKTKKLEVFLTKTEKEIKNKPLTYFAEDRQKKQNMKNQLGKRLVEGASNASRLLGEMKMLHAKKRHLIDETILCALRDCMAREDKYRSAFDIFEEKRNIKELLETIGEYNDKLAACVESLRRL